MIVFYEGKLKPVPFCEMFDTETGKPKMRYVDITSEPYLVGREYMMRLEKEDFKPENIKKIAAAANMKMEEFKKRFLYIA
jgi:6-phosphofructokinase 1